MKPVEIMYDPLPLHRVGVRLSDDEVVVGVDYSCFAYMLEEYISFGAVKIVMPSSSPDAKMASEVPDLIARNLRVVDDLKENEVVEHLLSGLRKEFSVQLEKHRSELNTVGFVKTVTVGTHTPDPVRAAIVSIHRDLRRLAFGFNHGVSIDLNIERCLSTMRLLRQHSQSLETRSLIAQLEGMLSHYQVLSFGSGIPKDSTPRSLISIFDRLVNDPDYFRFSENISQLTSPHTRERALVEMRYYIQRISAARFVGTGWDYVTRLLKIWPGVPLPEAKDIASLISGREAPLVLDLSEARARAVENWKSSYGSSAPLRGDGTRLSNETIEWLPPLPSMKVGDSKSHSSMGTSGELLRALQEFETKHSEQ